MLIAAYASMLYCSQGHRHQLWASELPTHVPSVVCLACYVTLTENLETWTRSAVAFAELMELDANL